MEKEILFCQTCGKERIFKQAKPIPPFTKESKIFLLKEGESVEDGIYYCSKKCKEQ